MDIDYAGQELEAFARATNWKAYLRAAIGPYLTGDVAEVGAGLGETARALRPGSAAKTWTAIEPDPAMAAVVAAKAATGELGDRVIPSSGTLADLPDEPAFDCVVYVDVLEHIEHDRAELELACRRLRSGGRIVVLSPAYPWLYSPFDRAIGHYRRYTKAMLRAIAPPGMAEHRARYLDSAGFVASAANRLILRQSMPSGGQVGIWDGLMVPVSRLVDPLLGYLFGRSVLIVWTKP